MSDLNLKKEESKSAMSIVDQILQDRATEIAEVKSMEPDVPTITAQTFFQGEQPNQVASKEQFGAYLEILSPRELNGLQYLLKALSNNVVLDMPPFTSLDQKTGKHHMWITKRGKMGNAPFNVVDFGKLSHFVGLYQFGIVKFNVSLEDLYQEFKN